MNFYLAFFQSKIRHKIPEYSFWEYYIKNGILESGNEFIEDESIDWAYGYAIKDKHLNKSWKNETWQKVIDFLKINRTDIFLSYLYPEQIDSSALTYISKELGIPTVNFYCDNLRDFKEVPIEFYAFTLNWVPELQALGMYEKANKPYIHLPMPMWVPTEFRSQTPCESTLSSFIGSRDYFRHLFFEKLKNKYLESYSQINIYGSGWVSDQQYRDVENSVNKLSNQIKFLKAEGVMKFLNKLAFKYYEPKEVISGNGKLTQEEYFKYSRESLVVIGLSSVLNYNYHPLKPLRYSRLRDIEVPMLGGCYLVESNPDIFSLYEVDKDIFTFCDVDDFNLKFNELLKYPELRTKLRLNGQRRATEDLNISVSLAKVIKRLT